VPVDLPQFAGDGLPGQVDGLFVIVDLVEEFEGGTTAILGLSLLENIEVLVEFRQGGF